MPQLADEKTRDITANTTAFLCRFARIETNAYRNKVVHDVQLGTARVGEINLTPRIDKIQKYATMTAIQGALNDQAVLKEDFVVREEQMFSDFRTFKERLNALRESQSLTLGDSSMRA
jgi:hypothetical protein